MIRTLLLACFLLAASATLSVAQSDPTLGQASTFTVLAATEIINNGETGVTGNVGVAPGSTIIGKDKIVIERGRFEENSPASIAAQSDAAAAYNSLAASMPANALPATIGRGTELTPGTHKLSGDLSLQGVLTLNGLNDLNAVFIIIVDGNINSNSPTAGIRLVNGAQSKNVYWVVSGGVEMGSVAGVQGTFLVKKDIMLNTGVIVAGRMISLGGKITFNSNNLYLPTIVEPNLSVKKTAPAGDYKVGDNITYTIAVHNEGPGTATDVVVKDSFPANLRYVPGSAVYTDGTFNESTATWSMDLVQFGETREIQLTFEILTAGTIVNVATVDTGETDPKQDDNTDEVVIEVPEVSSNLNVTKVATGAPYVVGGNVTYTITVSNAGPYAAEAVSLTEQLPAGLEFVSATVSQGSYNSTTGLYTIGGLAVGEQATLTLVTKIVAAGKIINTVVVSPGGKVPDNNPGDNTDEEEIDVTCQSVPAFEIAGELNLCEGVSGAVYTATAIPNATYTYTLSGGLTNVAQAGNTITLAAGVTSGTLQVKATDLCGNTYTATKEISVVNALDNPVIEGPTAVCQNSTGNVYTGPAYADGVTYTWVATGDLQIEAGNNSPAVQVSAGVLGGTLTLVASNSCFTTPVATAVITTTTLPAAPATITGSADVCAGSETTYTAEEVTGATGYTWTLPTGWSIVSGKGTAQVTVQVGAASGNVLVTADNNCGGSSATAMAVTVNDKLAAPAITGEPGACIGERLTYNIAAVTGATGYTWAVPATWTLVSGQNTTGIVVEVGTGEGQVKVSVNNDCGTGNAATLNVAPKLAPLATNTIVGDGSVCRDSQSLTYKVATVEDGVTYNWTVPTGWTIVSGNGSGTITVNATATGGNITVVASNGCGTAQAVSTGVSITVPPVTPATILDKSNVCDGLVYSVAAVPNATGYAWSVPAGFSITSGQGTATITVKADNATATSGNVTVVALNGTCGSLAASAAINTSLADGQLDFPKAFSPNGDNKNDVWFITNLDKFPNSEVTIFNRWGSEVYKTKNYQNDWRGNNLEQGTYFYKVRVTVCNGVVKEFTGYVTLFR